MSELLPHISTITDKVSTEKVSIVRSVSTTPVNNDPALNFMHTGHNLPGQPSIGAWLSDGLGTMNRELPDFVVLVSRGDLGNMQPLNNRFGGAAFYHRVLLECGCVPGPSPCCI